MISFKSFDDITLRFVIDVGGEIKTYDMPFRTFMYRIKEDIPLIISFASHKVIDMQIIHNE